MLNETFSVIFKHRAHWELYFIFVLFESLLLLKSGIESEIGKTNISDWHPGHSTRIVFIIAKVAMHFEKQKLKASTQVVKSC